MQLESLKVLWSHQRLTTVTMVDKRAKTYMYILYKIILATFLFQYVETAGLVGDILLATYLRGLVACK